MAGRPLVQAGGLLDLSATVSVRTPGHAAAVHVPGWHLWYRTDPAHPVRVGPLALCHAIELRTRGTCPGIRRLQGLLAPRRPAGPAPVARRPGRAAPCTGHCHWRPDRPRRRACPARLGGIIGRLRAARRGERNRLLFWASLRAGELVADGDLDARVAVQALTSAAAQIGLADEDGPRAIAATIRSGCPPRRAPQ